jgi:hypothetical protein
MRQKRKTMSQIHLTDEQLEQELAARKKAKAKAAEKAKNQYESDRDQSIQMIMTNAIDIFKDMKTFKELCHQLMDTQADKLSEYGLMRSNSKGGFSITTLDGQLRVTRTRNTEPVFDERSEKAIELIKDFLSDTVKKRDLKLYEILISLISRNKNQDLQYSEVMNLLQHEDKFEDTRWKEGLRLIKESYSNHLKGYGYEFKRKAADGKWEHLNLNFSSL